MDKKREEMIGYISTKTARLNDWRFFILLAILLGGALLKMRLACFSIISGFIYWDIFSYQNNLSFIDKIDLKIYCHFIDTKRR
jgi:hypothetical protein